MAQPTNTDTHADGKTGMSDGGALFAQMFAQTFNAANPPSKRLAPQHTHDRDIFVVVAWIPTMAHAREMSSS